MFRQDLDPTGSPTLSALLALLPLIALLVLLGAFRWKAHWASLVALGVSLVIAVFTFSMPVGQALDAGVFGAALSVLNILWITFNAIWIYNLTVRSGHFAVLRRAFASISDDRRIQAIVIAFSFGALLEALAGGGSPVAICAVMLIAIGFDPLKAAALALIADTAPVAFGGLGNPITILGTTTGLSPDDFGAMAGRQTAILAVFVPFILIGVADGRRGLRQAWPAALTAGLTFGICQFVFSNYWSYKLCDIFAALVSAGAIILLNRVWSPGEATVATPVIAGGSEDVPDAAFERRAGRADSGGDRLKAFAPYIIIVVLFSIAQITSVKTWLTTHGVWTFAWPGLHVLGPKGKPANTAYVLNYLGATGTLLFVSGLLTLVVLRIGPLAGLRTYGKTIRQFGWAIFTILCVFALSYVMNLSGQISSLGVWLAKAGAFFAFLSPVVGWFGVTITGTDAGSNALFGNLQVTAAHQLNVSPTLFGAANTSGGVMAKMISPQNLAVGTAAVGIVGAEGTLFRRVFGWSALLLVLMCLLVWLQSTPVLGWMVP
ncbi:L-lactate permease [Actinoallomurus bryophytorum]|uniref:L-lactate permease n=1 Tax=Actinoallomurus bryophytorum TaxID=1490222 RepID=A0A543CCT2_9ACTN|nr:L-lactate permease [Actinoallomurus bryophytorum]TQL94889.1 lactate permease [Actinoallomurus bryophytorum]